MARPPILKKQLLRVAAAVGASRGMTYFRYYSRPDFDGWTARRLARNRAKLQEEIEAAELEKALAIHRQQCQAEEQIRIEKLCRRK